MADENWQRVRKIFDEAIRLEPEERPKFVRRECGKDKALLADVESLLASLESAESFMEKPAIAGIAEQMLRADRQFSSGQFLNHYKIIRPVGAGGMGEVYLAEDTKLFRRVALKILRENLLSDKQANRRLLREAQAAALLDHPNICAIYEISETADCSFIVMQYVEGETLAERLAGGRLTALEALDLAIQIADALAEAHRHGIIHRDVKPANIIINQKGQAKVLDFGLAKIIEADEHAVTETDLHSSGSVMGTVPFMSPEQLCGKRLDTRTDIFSFGVLFYEMLTGRRAFPGDSNAERISAILNDQPDWSEIPEILQPILRKCLMKKSDARYQTAEELMRHLLDVKQSGKISPEIKSGKKQTVPTERVEKKSSEENVPPVSKSPNFYFWKSAEQMVGPTSESVRTGNERPAAPEFLRFNRLLVLLSVGLWLFLVGGALIFWKFGGKDELRSFDALRGVGLISWKTGGNSDYSDFRVSHNGRMLAYSSTQNGENEAIYVKQTADGDELRVTKDEWRNHSPIWSPDDQRIAFVSIREGAVGIYACPSLGGVPVPLKITDAADLTLRHWSADGASIFYESNGNFFRLDLATQEIVRITDFPDSSVVRYFGLSPDEKQIVFCDKGDGDEIDVWTMPLAGGAARRLTNDAEKEIRPLWHPDGARILYNVERRRDKQINLAYADARAPVQVTRGDGDYEMIDLSPDGTKIYYFSWESHSDIGLVDLESGVESEYAAGIESELWADVSPDGKSIVSQINDSPHLTQNLHDSTIVVKPLENRSPPLLVKGYNPRWLPDSRRVAFYRWQETSKKYEYWTVDTISGEEKQLTNGGISAPAISRMPVNRLDKGKNWSPDAQRFVYTDSERKNVRLTSVETSETVNLTNSANADRRYYSPQWSPDGRRIVFLSTEKAQSSKWSVWVSEQGVTKEVFSTTANLRLLGMSAPGSEIWLLMTDGVMKASPLNIRLVEVSLTGTSRILNEFKNIYASSVTISNDGKMVAYTARQNDRDDIWTSALSGGEPKKRTANANSRLFFGSPAWSPDGKTIFFDKQDQINTISVFVNFN